MEISVDSNAQQVADFLNRAVQKQILYAGSVTVNNLAFKARETLRDEINRELEQPIKPFTRNMLRVVKAQPRENPAEAYLQVDDNKNERHVLGHLFRGGSRNWKNMEGALLRAGILKPGYYAIPGEGCKVDRYGNIPPSFVRTLLSYFKTLEIGNMRDDTKAKMADKRMDKKKGYKKTFGVEYFISYGPGSRGLEFQGKKSRQFQNETVQQHLPYGIWSRRGFHGVQISPILMFVKKRKPYKRYFNMLQTGIAVRNRYAQQYFDEALAKSLSNSRELRALSKAV